MFADHVLIRDDFLHKRASAQTLSLIEPNLGTSMLTDNDGGELRLLVTVQSLTSLSAMCPRCHAGQRLTAPQPAVVTK